MQVFYNARIYTMDVGKPIASALIVEGDRFSAVGEDEGIQSLAKASAKSKYVAINLQGRTVLPGLTDAHIHLENYALGLKKVDCETPSRQECLQRVVERARNTPTGEWIFGHGWNQNSWPEGFGTAADLAKAAPNHPVYLTAKSLHAAWANSQALREANLTDVTPDPPGGRFGRDDRGRLNGVLFEGAMDLVVQAIPEPRISQVAEAIRFAQPLLWRMGLTGVHDFDRKRCFTALQLLHRNHELKLRVIKSLHLENLEHAAALGLATGFGDDFLRLGSVKAFSDGALGPQTAAMLQPYNDSPTNRGMLLLDAEELSEQGRAAIANGLSLAVHAIGDRANHEVLDAFDDLRNYEADLFFNGDRASAIRKGLRHRIEHVQVIHTDDAARIARLGVVASMQPIHATSDMLMADRYWGERAKLSYAWRTQLSSGAVLAFGSDAPVESPNPFWGLHAAVTRRRIDGSPGIEGWYPEQRLSLQEALQAYTVGAAYAGNVDDHIGRIAPGYLADMVVLNENPFTCGPDQLHEIFSVATMVGGEWVYEEF